MQLVIDTTGRVHGIYSDALDLQVLGPPCIARASSVEPDAAGFWHVDLSPVAGPVLGPFARRGDALSAERSWLIRYWLIAPKNLPVRTSPRSVVPDTARLC